MNDISVDYIRIIREHGNSVGFDTRDCDSWKSEHGDCSGCPTELGCGKVVCLQLLTLSGKSPLDNHLRRILEAKTPQELLEIDFEPVEHSDYY